MVRRALGISAFCLFFGLWPVTAMAQLDGISGQYDMVGENPGGAGSYSGSVAIRGSGDVYQVAWTIGGSNHVGTGILLDDMLSVVYQPDNSSPGIAVYQLQEDGRLIGVWTGLGGNAVGTEVLVPRN